jgi:ABC-2 type transport system ATP-binding protein
MIILKIENLSKKVRNRTVLRDISFEIPKGSFIGILGPNGCGKSTLLKIILRLVFPTNGTLDIRDNLKIAAVCETAGFFPDFSIGKNLSVFLSYSGERKCSKTVMDGFGLSGFLSEKFKRCSTGMKRRAELAAALATYPELLILDEPSNGLDPEGMMYLRSLLLKVNQSGTTLIIASHILSELEKLCSHFIFMKSGRVVDFSEKDALLTRFASIEDAYYYFVVKE